MNPDSRDLIAQGKVDHREVESEGSRRQTKSEAVSKVTDTAPFLALSIKFPVKNSFLGCNCVIAVFQLKKGLIGAIWLV